MANQKMSLRNKKCVQINNNKVKKSNKKNRTKSIKNNNRKKYNNSIKKIRNQFAGMYFGEKKSLDQMRIDVSQECISLLQKVGVSVSLESNELLTRFAIGFGGNP